MKLPKPKHKEVNFLVGYTIPLTISITDQLLSYLGDRIKVVGSCWIWQMKDHHISVPSPMSDNRQTTIGVHPLMYKIYNGPLKKGSLLDRRCLKRMCVNPGHLSIGSYKEAVRKRKPPKRGKWKDRGAPPSPEQLDITETSSLGLGSTLDPTRNSFHY